MGPVLTGARLRAAAIGAAAIAAMALSACAESDDDVDLVAGKQLFVERCGSCHALGRAETAGTAGPNLDQAFQQALADGLGRDGIRGAVRGQILHPREGSPMPAGLVKGDDATAVAAYVARSVAREGEDTGLLATAVEKAGGGEPAVAENGVLEIPADPGGQLAYVTDQATAEPGELTVRSPNESSTPHDIAIDGKGKGEEVVDGGVSEFTASFEAGEYTYFCTLPGHREAGMEGTLVVE